MQKWKCHKVVEAAKIIIIERFVNGTVALVCEGEGRVAITGERYDAANVKPKEGDYAVRYEDGYISWSPKFTFEAGYTLIQEDEKVDMTARALTGRNRMTGLYSVVSTDGQGRVATNLYKWNGNAWEWWNPRENYWAWPGAITTDFESKLVLIPTSLAKTEDDAMREGMDKVLETTEFYPEPIGLHPTQIRRAALDAAVQHLRYVSNAAELIDIAKQFEGYISGNSNAK